ncbi:MAG: hypothetical protein COV76_06365 [Candidatus Omnitrophica bacterium CG11_big_fil_rev_8_21_14_0_20_64_10]|nr:MAG: hypothetical protein COV76_06365 [Candidatus Omnitrophica bacterium CG11_big_fil_rev_8_21_14_0_20_64_10]
MPKPTPRTWEPGPLLGPLPAALLVATILLLLQLHHIAFLSVAFVALLLILPRAFRLYWEGRRREESDHSRREFEAIQEKMVQDLARTNARLISATEQLRQTNRDLRRLVLLDPLTEVLNRRGLHSALSVIHSARRGVNGWNESALLVAVDDFKRFNAVYGRGVGDGVLREIARRIRDAVRVTDYVSRIGGDEFLVLLPETRLREGIRTAEKIRLAVGGRAVQITGARAVRVTVSVGLVKVPGGVCSIDALLELTHPLVDQSKEQGKNRVSFHLRNGADRSGPHPMEVLLNQLRKPNRFYAVAQPIYRLDNLNRVGFELLSRSRSPGFEMPDDFFRACAEANLLTWSDQACFESCAAAAAALPDGLRVHLNLFPSTFLNISVWKLLELLRGDCGSRVFCIELSEQQILGDPSDLVGPVQMLKQEGFEVGLDDVGFGHSSLESLILLEPNLIKIDKRWISRISRDPAAVRGVQRLLRLARSIGAQVIAEGIESPEELDHLRNLGVPCGQGFLLGRPEAVPTLSVPAR